MIEPTFVEAIDALRNEPSRGDDPKHLRAIAAVDAMYRCAAAVYDELPAGSKNARVLLMGNNIAGVGMDGESVVAALGGRFARERLARLLMAERELANEQGSLLLEFITNGSAEYMGWVEALVSLVRTRLHQRAVLAEMNRLLQLPEGTERDRLARQAIDLNARLADMVKACEQDAHSSMTELGRQIHAQKLVSDYEAEHGCSPDQLHYGEPLSEADRVRAEQVLSGAQAMLSTY
jgi:hypothetical protein